MRPRPHPARTGLFFFLVLPYGIGNGFVTVTLPFALARAGVPVAAAASALAVAYLPATWRFLMGPITDLTLSLRRWYLLALAVSAVALVAVGLTPMGPPTLARVTVLALLFELAANLMLVPVAGLVAHGVPEAQKGRAAGWYQAGNLGGSGLGGGAGVWLVSHANMAAATAVLAAASLACAAAAFLVADTSGADTADRLANRLRVMGRDFRDLVRSPQARLVAVLVLSPIGVGAVTGLWSAVAPDWHASPNAVALTTGVLSGVVAVPGGVVGGWIADRIGHWRAFLSSGTLLAAGGILLAVMPRTAPVYAAGVLAYALVLAICFATWSALILHAIGRGVAATKYALLSSAGNVPVIYMTAFDGWAYARWGASGLLVSEALLAAACIALALPALAWLHARPSPTDAESGV